MTGCVTCDFEPFVKNNYFTGKMMGAAEFIVESHYHQEKMRLHQARLHGGMMPYLVRRMHTSGLPVMNRSGRHGLRRQNRAGKPDSHSETEKR